MSLVKGEELPCDRTVNNDTHQADRIKIAAELSFHYAHLTTNIWQTETRESVVDSEIKVVENTRRKNVEHIFLPRENFATSPCGPEKGVRGIALGTCRGPHVK
jgi:hypothetical protein